MTQIPPAEYQSHRSMLPHRGAVILVLGILSWVISCFIFGIIAWVMANNDLAAMARGEMDPSGEGLTSAGKIVGMIHVFVSGAAIVVLILFFVLVVVAGGSGLDLR